MLGSWSPAPLLFCLLLGTTLAGCLGSDGDPTQPGGEPVLLRTGEDAVFEAPEADQVLWSFGDGASSDRARVEHTYAEPGLYRVRLETLDAEGRHLHDRVVAVGTPSSEPLAVRAEPTPVGTRLVADADDVAWDLGGTVLRGARVVHAFVDLEPRTVTAYALDGDAVRSVTLQLMPTVAAPRFAVSDVGRQGGEPMVVESTQGCLLVTAEVRVFRSCDDGATWEDLGHPLNAPPALLSGDPFLWHDETTGRVFHLELFPAPGCVWVAWSDDGGDAWSANPLDCTVPVTDHEKLATGAWTTAGLGMEPTHPTAVYLCYNKVAGAWCHTSLDGGATFPLGQQVASADNANAAVDLPVPVGGLHGPIATAPDGTVLLPLANSSPLVGRSTDNGLTWQTVAFEASVGTPFEYADPEIGVDAGNNAYYAHVGADNRLYVFRSRDAGATWDETPIPAGGPTTSVTFPAAVAGDEGRIALAFLGTDDTDLPPGQAPNGTRWHLYVSYSLDALSNEPAFATVRVTDDPVQVGSVCVVFCIGDGNGESFDPAKGLDQDYETDNGNLLDFIDVAIGADGRVLASFADGCTEGCRDALDARPVDSRDDRVNVAMDGPRLRVE